jgi:hypothetical protein
MKRTLFKLGRHFVVESRTEQQSFTLDQDVDEWRISPRWEFVLATVDVTTRRSGEETGTSIEVDNLHKPVADDLSNANWTGRLRSEVRLKHRLALNRGLTIEVNGQRLEPSPLELIETDEIRPGRRTEQFPGGVEVDLLAGVGESDPTSAGWYVFCNDRLVECGFRSTARNGREPPATSWITDTQLIESFTYRRSSITSAAPWVS